MLLDLKDKFGGSAMANSSRGGVRRLNNDHTWINLDFDGPKFTWSNRRQGNANIQEQLDRGLANAD